MKVQGHEILRGKRVGCVCAAESARCCGIKVTNLVRGLKVRELEEVFASQVQMQLLCCESLLSRLGCM